jgi:hypothetical protein
LLADREGSSGLKAKLSLVGRRLLPGVLAVAAALADSGGAHGLARDALLGALPFAAVAALVTFGDYLDSRERAAGLQALCSGAIVCLLVLSCAVRSSSGHGAPQLAISSLLAALGLLAVKLAVALAPYARRLGSFSPAKP